MRGLALLMLVLAATGCGGGGGTQPFSRCGNGIVEDGERCDPGFTCSGGARPGSYCSHSSDCGSGGVCNVNDRGSCVSTCEPAYCGDDLVYAGVEDCDGTDVDGKICADFGLAGSSPVCAADCKFDLSPCGTALPATPTPTATATPTVAFTPTATPPVLCGNGTIDEGETCDDGNTLDGDVCPPDCSIAACVPDGRTVAVDVRFTSPDQALQSLALLLTYPEDTVSIPGKRNEASVLARVVFASGATGGRNDLDYQLLMTPRLSPSSTGSTIATVTFDVCTGSTVPDGDRFACRVTSASPNARDVLCDVLVR